MVSGELRELRYELAALFLRECAGTLKVSVVP